MLIPVSARPSVRRGWQLWRAAENTNPGSSLATAGMPCSYRTASITLGDGQACFNYLLSGRITLLPNSNWILYLDVMIWTYISAPPAGLKSEELPPRVATSCAHLQPPRPVLPGISSSQARGLRLTWDEAKTAAIDSQ